MFKATTLQLWVLAFTVLSGSMLPAAAEGDSSAAAVLDHHLHAFAAGDADAILADYTEDSVLITPQGILKGPVAIRRLFEAMVEEFSSPQASSTIHQRHAFGSIAYIIWSAETPQNSYRFATDTIYVVDGRILYQTFAADVVPK